LNICRPSKICDAPEERPVDASQRHRIGFSCF
jgi:hypothetical protein